MEVQCWRYNVSGFRKYPSPDGGPRIPWLSTFDVCLLGGLASGGLARRALARGCLARGPGSGTWEDLGPWIKGQMNPGALALTLA